MRLRLGTWILSTGIMAAGTGVGFGQKYPNQPIRVVTSEVGGGNDLVARQIAQAISGPLGQPVTVDNRPGGITPRAIIDRLNEEVARFLNSAGVKERFFSSGLETVAGSPEQLAATVKSELARMGKVIKDAGIRVE